uniref:Uncharacterized protein n=1 Tax=Setaria italica TaxID=4555 RepID=K3ZYR5_SETIT
MLPAGNVYLWDSDYFTRNFHVLPRLLSPLVVHPIFLPIYECSRHFPIGSTVARIVKHQQTSWGFHLLQTK